MEKEFNFDDMGEDFDALFKDVNELIKLESETLKNILENHNITSILDCACGSGIQSIGLAEMNYKVCASDISPRLINILEKRSKDRRLEITTKVSDFRNLKEWSNNKFDSVICMGNSLPLVEGRKDISLALEKMIQLTKTNGLIIIGLHNYLKLRKEKKVFNLRKANESEIIFDIRDFKEDKVKIDYLFYRINENGWTNKRYKKSYLMISPKELIEKMNTAGCKSVKLFDITGKRELNAPDDEEWILAVGIAS
jgi:glycine/sarcosine N-methyltransferase